MTGKRKGRILAVDDESTVLEGFRIALEMDGYEVVTVQTAREACIKVASMPFDVCLLDRHIGDDSGLQVLEKIGEYAEHTRVIMITGDSAVDGARQALEAGAHDYIVKPCSPEQLRIAVMRQLELCELSGEVESLRRRVKPDSQPVATRSPAMQSVLDTVAEVAGTDANVLVLGESGTGKGVIARALHEHSHRSSAEFVTINCPSLTSELLESELFGHTKGAFTGAVQASDGRVAHADGGTLFLDEIGDFPMALQPKLLRFIQDKEYERLGDPATRRADVRIVSATNRDLDQMVRDEAFRLDLLYRINVIALRMPALRERREDIVPLAERFLAEFAQEYARPAQRFTDEAVARLCGYHWPGNVRELRNVIERAVILCASDAIAAQQLALDGGASMPGGTPANAEGAAASRPAGIGTPVTLAELEKQHVEAVIASADTLEEAARVLGINASTLYRKRRDWGH